MIATDERQLEAGLEHVEVNGVRLAYVQRGAGEPVVFVHGGISDLTIWDPILEPLSRGYRAIAYSRRYAWPNEPILEGVADTIAQHARDLASLIETLELGPANLVGNSWGGFVCLVVARDRPDLVRRLVVQEPPVIPLFLGAPPSPLALLKTLITRPRTGRALAGMIFNGMQPTQAALKRGAVEESIEIFVRRVALGDAGYDELPEWVKRHMRLNSGTHVSPVPQRRRLRAVHRPRRQVDTGAGARHDRRAQPGWVEAAGEGAGRLAAGCPRGRDPERLPRDARRKPGRGGEGDRSFPGRRQPGCPGRWCR